MLEPHEDCLNEKMREDEVDEVIRAHKGEGICKGEKVGRKFFRSRGWAGRSSRQEATDEF